VSHSFGYIPRSGIAGSYGISMLDFYEASNFFLERFYQFAFPPVVYKSSFFPTSSPTPIISGVFNDDYSNRGMVES
jgi:hypothetical protein